MGMTMAEKILAAHAGKKEVKPGEYVWASIDGTAIGMSTPGILKKYSIEKFLIPTAYMQWKTTLPHLRLWQQPTIQWRYVR